jgi:hypothetical protein
VTWYPSPRADRAPVNDSWGFVKDNTSAEVVVRHTAFDKSYTLARRAMIWTADSKWIVLYSTLATLFIFSWAFVPA